MMAHLILNTAQQRTMNEVSDALAYLIRNNGDPNSAGEGYYNMLHLDRIADDVTGLFASVGERPLARTLFDVQATFRGYWKGQYPKVETLKTWAAEFRPHYKNLEQVRYINRPPVEPKTVREEVMAKLSKSYTQAEISVFLGNLEQHGFAVVKAG
ncbi:hypothetical protein D869_gp153 [Caulobacter phage CcrRogue]|uniref:Uncharacterized protein n=1 Tax=Caulobacter phage CcrRogue TaxID=2927986 RepID=K4JP26_9CAUD|nr:hypothetical protein D869_gp153 [Caulobacter phage CcrRogue]AFU86761.1 hypothetical protein CcrRogue_gp279 [Caulobacter phage CcrRogue]